MVVLRGTYPESKGIMRNWARWSDIDMVKFPDLPCEKLGTLENMLSIKVFECGVILVGWIIWGTSRLDEKVSK